MAKTKRGRPIKEGSTAEVWLRGLLDGGDRPSTEIQKLYKGSPDTLKRAKKRLGVLSYNTTDNVWFWTLKTQDELDEARKPKPIPIPPKPIWEDDARLDEVIASGSEYLIRNTANAIEQENPRWWDVDGGNYSSAVTKAMGKLRNAEKIAKEKAIEEMRGEEDDIPF